MGDLVEIAERRRCRIYFERNCDTHRRYFYSATVQLPNHRCLILDDRLLPRLKRRLDQVLTLVANPHGQWGEVRDIVFHTS